MAIRPRGAWSARHKPKRARTDNLSPSDDGLNIFRRHIISSRNLDRSPAILTTGPFRPQHLQHLRSQMLHMLHSLGSTFTTCAPCGAKAKDCAVEMTQPVHYLTGPSPLSPLTVIESPISPAMSPQPSDSSLHHIPPSFPPLSSSNHGSHQAESSQLAVGILIRQRTCSSLFV
jgi:hypothetical protein